MTNKQSHWLIEPRGESWRLFRWSEQLQRYVLVDETADKVRAFDEINAQGEAKVDVARCHVGLVPLYGPVS